MKQMNKNELVDLLVNEYGYDKNDVKFDSDGKPYTNAKLREMVEAEKEDEKQAIVNSNRKVAPRSKIKGDDRIVIMSGIDSVSYYSERSNRSWKFESFGQQDLMEFSELVSMNNKYPSYIKEGYFIVLDKDVQIELGLTEMYENILIPDNIDKVFSMGVEELMLFVDSLPEGQKRTLVHRAVEKYEKDELSDMRVYKFFQEKFDFSFEDNAPLGDIVSSVDTGAHNIIYVDKN